MTSKGEGSEYERVSLAEFRARTREVLGRSQQAPVILTNHGRETHAIASADYFRQLEGIAAETIMARMNLKSVRVSSLTVSDRAIIERSRPTADEIAADRWND